MAGELRHADPGVELTAAEYLDIAAHILNNGALGDLLWFDGTHVVRLPIGTDGWLIRAVSGRPQYSAAAPVANYMVKRITVADSPYTVDLLTDDIVEVDSSGGVVTVNMPTATGNQGRTVDVVKVSVDVNIVTITPAGGQTIQGQANLQIDQPDTAATLYGSTATNWRIK